MEDLEGWRTIGQLEGKVDSLVASVHSMSNALTSNISETKQEIRLLGERMARLEKASNGNGNSNGGSKIRIREVVLLAASLTGAGGSATLWQRYSEVAAQLDYMQHHVQAQGQGQSSAQPQTNR